LWELRKLIREKWIRLDVRVKESFKKKLVRNRLKWAGHVEIIDDGK